MMTHIIGLYNRLSDRFPDAFGDRYGGSSVAQCIRPDGTPVEIGLQQRGTLIPSYAPASHHAVAIGPLAAREMMIVQWASARAHPQHPKEIVLHTERALLTRYDDRWGTASSHTQTVSRQRLDPLLRRTFEGAHLLSADQADAFAAETAGLPPETVAKLGQEVYHQAGALAVITFSEI